jgi:transcriptional regulator with XRE-family HTH domain
MADAVDTELAQISRRIRTWREEAGFTLQELARRSRVATSTIQKVETEQMIPSLAVVLKIARGLGRSSAELVRDAEDELSVVHLRARDRQPIGVPGVLEVERLTGDLFEPAFETWRITMHPGTSSGKDAISYNGESLIVSEKGALTVRLGEQETVLRAGDTLHFKASIPHFWRNDGDSPARFCITGTLSQKLRAILHKRAAHASRAERRAR